MLHFAVKTNFRELISTYPNFSNPSTTFDRVALHPPIRDSEDHGPGRAFRHTPAPLGPAGQPGLTRLRSSTPR